MAAHPHDERSRGASYGSFLEAGLPWIELSLLATADQRSRDPAYGAHRWWARRPPAVMRGLLLAAACPADKAAEDFWSAFASAQTPLSGLRVHDPFTGGGSTLVEARRLGAEVSGTDVDPLAALITNFELDPPGADELKSAGELLINHLEERTGELFPRSKIARPLHYFYLRTVSCPTCAHEHLLYRDLVLARDRGKVGAVVRDYPLTVFCPSCFAIHDLNHAERVELRCCDRRFRIDAGTFSSTRYTCPSCGDRWTHSDLKTGVAPRRLIAVEESRTGGRRRIRAARRRDRDAISLAATLLDGSRRDLALPSGLFERNRRDGRPLTYGVSRPTDLFSERQLVVLGTAFAWAKQADLTPSVRRAVTLALSNALSTNNLLCGYAADYGRLSALFSVRSYSLPALSVELNPLHVDGGRGTITRALHRVVRSTSSTTRRHVWSFAKKRPEAVTLDLSRAPVRDAVACASATTITEPSQSVDICVTDPPYFDYISYSELSEFHRAWLGLALEEEPLLPTTEDGAVTFAATLGRCLRSAVSSLKVGRPLAFTYHATTAEAWEAIGLALDEAKLVVTALWPLRNDTHMGHHSFAGNCEWDVVVVCRRLSECERAPMRFRFEDWQQTAQKRKLRFSAVDKQSAESALKMASTRFAILQRSRAHEAGEGV